MPFIARLLGVIPAGRTSKEPGIMMDVFPTVLALGGVKPPDGTKLDGSNLMPVFQGQSATPHEALFLSRGEQLCAVRAGKWKLHACPHPNNPRAPRPDEKWIDPRGPDGVRILAPYEQTQPSDYPGLSTGDTWRERALFDLENDPCEQHNVIAAHPDVAEELFGMIQKARADSRAAQRGRMP